MAAVLSGEGWGGAGAAGLSRGGAAPCAVLTTARNANDANELVSETGNTATPIEPGGMVPEPAGMVRFFDDFFRFGRRRLALP